MWHRTFFWALALGTLLGRSGAQAQAKDAQPVRGTILQLDGEDIVIDLGKQRVSAAQALTVYRAIEVRHPITHRALRDRFAIGTISIVQPGDTLSVAKANGVPAHPFAVGDAVELPIASASGVAASARTPEPVSVAQLAQPARPSAGATQARETAGAAATQAGSTPAVAPSTEERDLAASWYATLAKPPERRAQIYAALLERYPESRYRNFLMQEIAYLRELAAKAHVQDERERAASTRSALASSVKLLPLHSAQEGEAVDLAGLVRDRESVRSLILHARPLEGGDYASYPVSIDPRGHARVRLPATVARAPGFAYFVEAVDKDGQAVAAVGTVHAPEIVVVRALTRPPAPTEPRTSVRFSSEIVSFDGTTGRDYFLLTEGDFLYRVRYGRLYGVRIGYGNYNGQGGTVDQLDRQHLTPQPAGFSYGFIETELELHRLFGLAARGTVGLGRPNNPSSERDGLTGGFQLRARIGAADGTHLVLAGELMPEIGQRAYIGLRFAPIERMPMAAEVVVTDQPVHSDELAVRLIYEVGYRVTDRIALALRPSYELRTIAHAGPGIGIAATFDW
jgi:hypothetical protein